MTECQKQLHDMVVMFIANEPDLTEQMIDMKTDEVCGLPTFSVLTDQEIEEVKSAIKSEFSIKLDTGFLIEEKGHEKWFLSRKAELDMKYWDRYRKYLLSDKGFSPLVVNTMDDVLDTLTDLLGDPTRDISYNRKGLIVGDVQSGKTANYTGLICKAVDSGYKVIVLLTGTIEKLRQQTQQRIDEGFVGASSDAMMKQQEDQLIVGVGKYDSTIRPMVLTSTVDDFKQKNATNLGFDLRNINGPVIFVIKKNSAVLQRLNKWLRKFNQNGAQKIDHSLLVIDDEADNASVNTKKDPEDSPTAINGHIRDLVNMFVKSSYVGFTATPFANIFIDPYSYNDMVADDLFPKDYIYSLNAPSNYTGARDIFAENGSAKYMLEVIDDDPSNPNSIEALLPLRHRSSTVINRIPLDLKKAIAAFLLANTIEDLNGTNKNHRSMLINISRFTDVQDQVAVLVNDYLKNMQLACKNYGNLPVETAIKNSDLAFLKEVYESVYSDIDYDWAIIQNHLHKSCAGIIVQTFNRRAGQNVNYSDYKDGLRIIAVGGMSLSRGLTLEGLVISYFYRNSKMYDTLMQMGRWFGYRIGYEKLCRIWMSEESIEWYRHISQSTDELREEIERYQDTGLTPKDFGLRVRSDITSLLVTARNKMRTAESRECVISLSGEYIETPELYSDKEKNDKHFEAIKDLIETLSSENYQLSKTRKRNGNPHYGYKDIPKETIMTFLERLDVSPKNETFNTASISKFIKDYEGPELNSWDISFASGSSETPFYIDDSISYYNPTRSYALINEGKILKISGKKRRLGTANDATFGITHDQVQEVRRRTPNASQKEYFVNVRRNPLLFIYAVTLTECVGTEKDLQDEGNSYSGETVFGFGIGIPTLSNQKTKYATYILNRIAIENMFAGEIDDWDEENDD